MKSTRFILGVWCIFCVWVLLACKSAYLPIDAAADLAEPVSVADLRFGLPAWVFWGVAVPWLSASAVTVAYAFFGIRQEPQDVG